MSPRIVPMLNALSECDTVGEIIIVDNNKDSKPELPDSKKIKVLEQEENIYVNPAWNLAVSVADYPVCFLMNDDITFDVSLLEDMCEGLTDFDVIGLHYTSYKDPRNSQIFVGHNIGRGWGCLMCFETKMWIDIPEQMKIWSGDQWIAKMIGNPGSISFPVQTEMSTTSNRPEMMAIKLKDQAYWQNHVK